MSPDLSSIQFELPFKRIICGKYFRKIQYWLIACISAYISDGLVWLHVHHLCCASWHKPHTTMAMLGRLRCKQMVGFLAKRQLISKRFLGSSISSKKRTNELDFSTMIPQVDLFLFVFWRKLTTPKNHFEINWPFIQYTEIKQNINLTLFFIFIWFLYHINLSNEI